MQFRFLFQVSLSSQLILLFHPSIERDSVAGKGRCAEVDMATDRKGDAFYSKEAVLPTGSGALDTLTFAVKDW